MSADHRFMARALTLARRGLATTDPNPTVGCVLVREGRIVGEGFTAPAGGPHAEIRALAEAGGAAAGSTAYVSLEPCGHEGRTGPCTSALAAAGVERVVCATLDPNPLVDGDGIRALRAAGIDVETGVLEATAIEINRGFFARHTRGRPWVTLKIAASLDGRTALADGTSQWITGEPAREDVHRFRAHSSAVMTGVGTVLADDPALTARLDEAIEVRQPVRVIVDSGLTTPPTAKTLRVPGDVYIFSGHAEGAARDALIAAGAHLETVPAEPRCSLTAVLERLAGLEINTVWVEAGPALSGTLVRERLVDEFVVYLAPDFLGDTARGMLALPALADLDERCRLAIIDVRRIGRDLRIVARPDTVARAGGT